MPAWGLFMTDCISANVNAIKACIKYVLKFKIICAMDLNAAVCAGNKRWIILVINIHMDWDLSNGNIKICCKDIAY